MVTMIAGKEVMKLSPNAVRGWGERGEREGRKGRVLMYVASLVPGCVP